VCRLLILMDGDARGRRRCDRGSVGAAATAVANPQARRRHDAIGLSAAMAVAKDKLTIAVQEVGDPERPHLGGEG
jgi:hypothetical protein